jgi:hypothetical protein
MTGARFFPLLLVAALLGACSIPPRWARVDASPEQADRDEVDCQRQAAREVSTLAGGFYGPYYAPYGYGPYNRGISRPDPSQPSASRALEEARLTDLCMRARGYQRQ